MNSHSPDSSPTDYTLLPMSTTATAELLHWALIDHRHRCMEGLLGQLKAGDYTGAFRYYRALGEINEVVDDMLSSTLQRLEEFAPAQMRTDRARYQTDAEQRFIEKVTPNSSITNEPTNADDPDYYSH